METTFKQMKKTTRLASVTMILLLAFTTFVLALGGGRYPVDPWSFGLNGDTQWTPPTDPTGQNPNNVSAAVAGALNQQFIDKGVKFVIQMGDLSDRSGDAAMYARADVAKSLYYQGIGFFPLRGNHEEIGYLYGLDPNHDLNIPAFLGAFSQTRGLSNTFGAYNFNSPAIDYLKGLSYSFEYGSAGNNARFVIVDVEQTHYVVTQAPVDPLYGQGYFYIVWTIFKATATVPGGSIPAGAWFRIDSKGKPSTDFKGYDKTWPLNQYAVSAKYDATGTEYWPGMQQDWISMQLDKSTRGTEHAFVFSHRPLMGANHADGFFGSNPGSKASTQNPFYASLMNNGVKYMISAHDHIYNRALVKSPDGLSQVEQLISTGASTKFYSPASLNSFISSYGDVKQRETQISQEINNIGYYIYTVDGPRVTVDYYSDAVGNFEGGESGYDYPDGTGSLVMPKFNFVKKETWGYSLNGQQFLVTQGGSYTGIEGSFRETTAKILAGTNNSTTMDFTPYDHDADGNPIKGPRALTKTVNTGWVTNPDPDNLKSDIISLWGMSELGAAGQTDTYVLSLSVDWRRMVHLGSGCIGIATFVNGKWVNAINENIGGEKKFVVGPYNAEYGLGTYGVDPDTKTAWAVLNFNADFAVAMDIEQVPGQAKKGK
jgi:hypothetical protein